MAVQRTRNWAVIAYPESLDKDWKERLDEEHIPAFISPLHDQDVNPTGEKKKAHYHILMMFAGNKTEEQVQKISDEVLSGVKVEKVKDLRAYSRYLCHIDNPEKAQYKPCDVICLGGVDYLEQVGTLADTDIVVAEMMEWCRKNKVYSFARLCDYSAEERKDWLRVLSSKRTVFMSAYLRSLQWEHDQEMKRQERIEVGLEINEVRKMLLEEIKKNKTKEEVEEMELEYLERIKNLGKE